MQSAGLPSVWMFALLAVLPCGLLLAGCGIRFGSRVSLFDDERAVATALSAMKSHYSGPVRANKLFIADDHMIFQALDPRGLQQPVEFRMHRQDHHFFSWDRVVGPIRPEPGHANQPAV